jgi:DNA repair protein RadC
VAAAYPGARDLASATPRDLAEVTGAAGREPAWARRVPAAFRLAALAPYAGRARDSGAITQPGEVAAVVRARLSGADREHFAVVHLDARSLILDVETVAIGTLASVDVHPRSVFRGAIRRNTHAIVVAHNHPSGVVEPSDADHELTRRLVDAGELVGIPVVDHVIVAGRKHYSMLAEGAFPG